MDGPPTEREHAEEAEKKRLNTKVFPLDHQKCSIQTRQYEMTGEQRSAASE